MIIRKFGIELHRLRHENIELLRQKRNENHIRNFMFYRKIITPEEQEKWFSTINNERNYYFLIKFQGAFHGVISGTHLDYEKRESEGGLFIWNKSFQNTFLPVISSVLMAELTFFPFEFSTTRARVRKGNHPSLQYNFSLGYKVDQESENTDEIVISLTKSDFLEKGKRIIKAVHDYCRDPERVSFDDFDFGKPDAEEYITWYKNLPEYILDKISDKLGHPNDN